MNAQDYKAAIEHEIQRLILATGVHVEEVLETLEEIYDDLAIKIEALQGDVDRLKDESGELEDEEEWEDDDDEDFGEEDNGDPYDSEYDR